MSDIPTEKDTEKVWPVLRQQSFLRFIQNKNLSYVTQADAKGRIMIIIYVFLIPFCISFTMENPEYKLAGIVELITLFLSFIATILIIYPKKYKQKKHNHDNLMHFSSIQQYDEEEYLEKMREALEDKKKLITLAVNEIYHMSKYVLKSKFFWLRVSLCIFLTGSSLALIILLLNYIPQ